MTLEENIRENMNLLKQMVNTDRQVFFTGMSWTQRRDKNYYSGVVVEYRNSEFKNYFEIYGFSLEGSMSVDMLNYPAMLIKFFEKHYNVIEPCSIPLIYVPSKRIASIMRNVSYMKRLRYSKEFREKYASWFNVLNPQIEGYKNTNFPFCEFSNKARENKDLMELRVLNGEQIDSVLLQ